jgi:hypothetical protein
MSSKCSTQIPDGILSILSSVLAVYVQNMVNEFVIHEKSSAILSKMDFIMAEYDLNSEMPDTL